MEGGRQAYEEEHGSERLCGVKRYPTTLRMLSREVDDVIVRGNRPLDVLVFRVPHCSMPSLEATQVQVTTAYVHSPVTAEAYVNATMRARDVQGLADCSTRPDESLTTCG